MTAASPPMSELERGTASPAQPACARGARRRGRLHQGISSRCRRDSFSATKMEVLQWFICAKGQDRFADLKAF